LPFCIVLFFQAIIEAFTWINSHEYSLILTSKSVNC
jgi:hypothetical protein